MIDFTIVILENAYASSVAITLDMLQACAVLAPQLNLAPPRWRTCSLAGGPIALQGGLSVLTQRLPRRPRQDTSTWVIPGLGLSHPKALQDRLTQSDSKDLSPMLARHVRHGGSVAACCSAVFLLQTADLLDGRTATTSWWLAPSLQQLARNCQVDARRMVCADGPITTAGAAMAQTDLMLHLLRCWAGTQGPRLSDLLCRSLLLDARQAQASFIAPELLANGNDIVQRATAFVEFTLPQAVRVSALAKHLNMSERTLARHVQRASGQTPQGLIHSIKAQKARHLQTSTRMSQEQLAEALGYQDTTALRRLRSRYGLK